MNLRALQWIPANITLQVLDDEFEEKILLTVTKKMDVLLQKHRAKHVCDIPDGLRELCADISREVIRSQPDDIYCFIAEYLNTLLITRENAKVAVRIVQSVTLKSEHIVEILVSTGLRLPEIAAVAPRLQKAFNVYLDAVDEQKKECGCDVDSDEVDDENEISICQILRATGASYPVAHRAAIRIQALFRGHQERMSLGERRGEVQWQRAAANTVQLLRKTGITRAEATRAAIIIQAAYRGYYTRKNLNRLRDEEVPNEPVDMCAWFRMILEENGITQQRANQAAIIIQLAYKRYRKRKAKEASAPSSRITLSLYGRSERNYDFGPQDLVGSARSVKSEFTKSRSNIKVAASKSQFTIGDTESKSQSKIGDNESKSPSKTGGTESKSQSKIGDTKSKSQIDIEATEGEIGDDAKTVSEVNEGGEEAVKTEEVAEGEQELPGIKSEAEAVQSTDHLVSEAEVEDQSVKEQDNAEHSEAAAE